MIEEMNVKTGVKFCRDCGAKILENAEICPKCGVRQISIEDLREKEGISSKSRLVAVVLTFFGGWFGINYFYIGQIKKGIKRLCIGPFGFFLMFIAVKIQRDIFYDYSSSIDTDTNIITIVLLFLGVALCYLPYILSIVDLIILLRGKMKDSKGLRVVK